MHFSDKAYTCGLVDISERDIHRSKYLLNAAIPESLSGCHPADVQAVKKLVFTLLDSDDPIYADLKPALMEGNLFDVARGLEFVAERSPDLAGRLFRQVAVLYAPIMTVKAVDAFEKAEAAGEDLGPHLAMSVRLYEKMGNVARVKKQNSLLKRFLKDHPERAEQETDSHPDSMVGELAYFPLRK